MTLARLCCLACAGAALAGVGTAGAQQAATGSTAFCLYEIPPEDGGKRRWINLGIVQYVEATRNELKISYGGGGLGSGHDAKISVGSMEEALATLERMRKAAASCR